MARKAKPATVVSGSDDLLGGLMDIAVAPPKTTTTKKSDRPSIQCESKEEIALLDALTSSDAIFKIAKSAEEMAKSNAKPVFKRKYLQLCVRRGTKPENPQIVSTQSKANFVVKHMTKLKLEGSESVAERLKQLGFDQEVIGKITGKIVKEKVSLGIKKFTDLNGENATSEQKAVAAKLVALVQKNLTKEELQLVLEKNVDAEVDKGWQDMAVSIACGLAKDDEDKAVDYLDRLYQVIAPQFVMSQMAYGGDLSQALKSLQAAPESDKEEIITSGNGKYKAVAKGKEVTLYLVKPDGDQPLGTKKCENPGHAIASARKWFREPEALTEFIATAK